MNAKEEFISSTAKVKVICAVFQQEDDNYERKTTHVLKKGYTQEQYDAFLASIDFEYDSGYGGQELFGTIWCEDGIWFDRGEYDGAEWWAEHQYPEICKECE